MMNDARATERSTISCIVRTFVIGIRGFIFAIIARIVGTSEIGLANEVRTTYDSSLVAAGQ